MKVNFLKLQNEVLVLIMDIEIHRETIYVK